MYVGQAELAALVLVGQLRVVDAELVQDRRVEVVHMDCSGRERVQTGVDDCS